MVAVESVEAVEKIDSNEEVRETAEGSGVLGLGLARNRSFLSA